MFTRVSFISLIVSGLILSSCQKHQDIITDTSGNVSVTLTAAPQTKAMADASVISLDVLAFRQDNGMLDGSARSDSSSLSINLPKSTMLDYYVIANAPKGIFSSIYSSEGIKKIICYLEQNTSSTVMVGSGSDMFLHDVSLTVPVQRLACKVTIRSITPEFYPQESADIVLNAIYLVNVNGSCPINGTPTAGAVWYNKLDYESGLSSQLQSLLYTSIGQPITGTQTLTDSYSFYCMPNPIDNNKNSRNYPQWAPRNTRIVVELSIGGKRNCYPITLPAMECNQHYIIDELVLKGSGSTHPDIPVSRKAISFDVSAVNWTQEEYELDFD